MLEDQYVAQLRFARYSSLPIGNIVGDFLRTVTKDLYFFASFNFYNFYVQVSDVHMARALTNDACLLWLSPADRPDLGGAEVKIEIYLLFSLK